MITQTETLNVTPTYPLEDIAPLEKCLIFDIETTGFSASRGMLYLIGAVYHQDGSWQLTQWFADTPEAESEVLEHFFSFAKNYHLLINFNGNTFDLPFLKKRSKLLGISGFDTLPESFDLFARCRPLKKLLKLPHMNLKTLEQFLGINRKDTMSGGDLIPVYKSYVMNHDPSLENLLLLHNRDDVAGTLALLPLLAYVDLLAGQFQVTSLTTEDHSENTFDMVCTLALNHVLPVPFSAALSFGYITATDSTARLLIHGIKGPLLYFFADYKNYYYLPVEDTAIHKSVATYVEKEHRVPAKAATCYCKKQGSFLPGYTSSQLPCFYQSYNSKLKYIELTPDLSVDSEALSDYIVSQINAI